MIIEGSTTFCQLNVREGVRGGSVTTDIYRDEMKRIRVEKCILNFF